jgi:WD40 repeat protein
VRFWDVASHKEIAALTGHQRRIHFVTFSHSGTWVATAGMDRNVKLWNVPKEPTARVSEQSSKDNEETRGETSHRGGVRSACKPEISKLCLGEEHVGQCLRKHKDELSVACQSAMGQGH